MATQREKPEPDSTSLPNAGRDRNAGSPVGIGVVVRSLKHQPIELLTENGFRVGRCWEVAKTLPPVDGIYPFLVQPEDELTAPREIILEVPKAACANIEGSTRGRIALASSFWIYCAERHLATYLWEHDDYPPEDRLRIDPLTPEDFVQALRWERT